MSEVQPARSIWQMAAKSLIAGAVMCVVAAAIAGGANWLAQRIALEQGKAQAALDAANLSLQNTQLDRARLEENLQMFGKLKQSRFAHPPDRLAILEALEGAARDLQKSAMAWELGIQENLRPLNDDKTGEAVAQLARVPMKLRANTVHEEEWLRLLSRLQGGNAGYFIPDSCIYERKPFMSGDRKLAAVDVQCSLSWLYVLPATGVPKTP
ncbi:hypothetical protein [Polaromonas sp.]|uniref:hypothetical protein n=1 Tax=Polaromonas sp. TaxID=1869339 RepID=UPI003CA2E59D